MHRLAMPRFSLPKHHIVVAHRGLSGHEPENSLRAFTATAGRGVEAIELDVHKTLDGVVIVCHDSEVAGLPVADSDHADLLARAPDLCTLKRALAAIPSRCLLDVEIKATGFEEDVLRELAQARDSRDYVVTSFDDRSIARVKAIDQTVRAGLLLGKDKPSRPVRTRLSELFPVSRLRSCNADFVAPHWRLLRLAFLRRMARRGYPVYVWTVNNDELMRSLVQRDTIAGLITDRPIDAMRIVNEFAE